MGPVMEPAPDHEVTTIHLGVFRPSKYGVPRVFRQLELNRSLGLALDHRNPVSDSVIFDQIGYGELDQIASAKSLIRKVLALYLDL